MEDKIRNFVLNSLLTEFFSIPFEIHTQNRTTRLYRGQERFAGNSKRMSADSSVTDDDLAENDSSRVLGVGSGTFAIAVLFFSTVLVWIFTSPQTEPLKSVIRSVVTFMFVTIFAILLLADRESQYQSTGEVVKVRF
jgi:hypothetical protein